MTRRPADLPEFERPPVVEVALCVQFGTLVKFRTVHAGLLWEHFRDDFPNFTEQPTVDPIFETFGKVSRTRQPRIEILSSPPIPRLWFINENQSQLIQFQPDRFVHNWRKITGSAQYPRYEAIKQRFIDEIGSIQKFLRDQDLGDIQANQCEVTYVNHIPSATDENLSRNLGQIFRFWNDLRFHEDLEEMEESALRSRFFITSETGEKIGRLSVAAEPARLADGTPAVAFTLTARGRPADASLEATSEFLDLGRVRIVRAFTALTTDAMHERWERTK